MRKLLTAGIFGTILGIVGAGTVNASIVSSGFLDEKLTEMTNATTLQLDNKANQSDLTNLSNIVGTPMELTYRDILRSSAINEIMGSVYQDTYGDNTVPTNNISELINLNYTDTNFPGLAGVVESLFFQRDHDDEWPLRLMEVFNDYQYLFSQGHFYFTDLIISGGKLNGRGITVYGLEDLTTKIGTLPEGITVQGMYEGWTDKTDGTTYLGIKDLNTKIGTLPEGITVYAMYDGWTNNGYKFPGLNFISLGERNVTDSYDGQGTARLLVNGAKATTIDGVDYTGPVYPLWKLSEGIDKIDSIETKIGTVPDGKNLAGMIGTLPAGYDSVGAALTAIKGIAEDAKAAALAAIPDPKQEGSSGKFVLTVDIVGDNATYRWEKIDREGETTTE